ncbi:MAG: RNA 2',3'-cyclic phosphodiesterase [Spirochaetes bacterium]|nr:RNA 2',3'-cyclic phosphodiesterase [Spirochaetota bacterium]
MANNKTSLRLFFALPAEGARELLIPVHERLQEFGREIKTVSPENFHITLKFLGETGAEISRGLLDDFKRIDPGIPPQAFILRGLGTFPDERRARVIWCGLDMDTDGILRLQKIVEELCKNYGFKKEDRPFKPHLTLARVRDRMKMPPSLAEYVRANTRTPYGESSFNRIVLFRSELRREGPLYTALTEIKFK